MCTIDIQKIIGDRNYPEAGDVLYELMVDTFAKGERLVVDMDGVSALPSMFLNTSIGRYIEENGADSIKGRLAFENITRSQVERLQDYVSKISKRG